MLGLDDGLIVKILHSKLQPRSFLHRVPILVDNTLAVPCIGDVSGTVF